MKRVFILWLVVTVVSQVTASAAPRLSLDQVFLMADSELKKHQQDPNAYQRPPGYKYAVREEKWLVFYFRKEAVKTLNPHVVFVVVISDKTNQPFLIRNGP